MEETRLILEIRLVLAEGWFIGVRHLEFEKGESK